MLNAGTSFNLRGACNWAPGESEQGFSCTHNTNKEAKGENGNITGGGPCGNKVKFGFPNQIVGQCGQNSDSGKASAE